ncbi:ATPase [Lysobacteraceae bacterium NML93-0792]|nr:ATPase [Xanthomonadaceae bacterium NML93-0792]PBS15947.1 ATPase [Xanthomonadaceae bacterium NML93-0793]PBS18872.1 ATPase [Xanthomonadaceae bacterium NML93-0831]
MPILRILAVLVVLLAAVAAWLAVSTRSPGALNALVAEMAPAPMEGSAEVPQWPPGELDWRPLDHRTLAGWGGPYWLRWQFSAPAGHAGDPGYALRLSLGAASRSWWNDRPVADNGIVGRTAAEEHPGRMDVLRILPPSPATDTHELVVLASNHHQWFGFHTATAAAEVVSIETLGRHRTWSWLIAAFAMGALGAACLYFLAVQRGRSRMPGARLLIALGVVGLALPVVEAWRPLLGYAYPWHGPRLLLLLVLHLAAAALLPAYIACRFAVAVTPGAWIAYLGGLVAMAVFLPGFDTRSAAVLLSSLLASTWLLLRAHGEQEERLPVLTLVLAGALALLFFGGAFLDGPYFLLLAVLMGFLLLRHAAKLRALDLRNAWLQGEHARLSLHLLQRSMQPHWLMNTLTSLQELIEQDPPRASRLVESLADQFERLRESSTRQRVPLDEELALCRSHLDIVGLALDRPIGLEIDAEDTDMLLPPGTLLAQVENALTHAGAAACALRPFHLSVRRDNETWILELRSARGSAARSGQGTGTRYIEGSLAAVSPGGWSFTQVPNGTDWYSRIELSCAS